MVLLLDGSHSTAVILRAWGIKRNETTSIALTSTSNCLLHASKLGTSFFLGRNGEWQIIVALTSSDDGSLM